MIKRPMLAATIEEEHIDKLRFPLAVSPKLDGLRLLIHPELGPVTRTFKPIPNEHVRTLLNKPEFHGYDGELMLPGDTSFNDVQSAFMARDGKPDFLFYVFDNFAASGAWDCRYTMIRELFLENGKILRVRHEDCISWGEVEIVEEKALEDGYEGIMLRDPQGGYKSGRSTMREQWLMKYKRTLDADGIVLGFVEQLHNANELQQDEFGLAKRSSHKDNLIPAGTLGKLAVQTEQWGTVYLGTGFTQAQRDEIWRNRKLYGGKKVVFKYQEVLKDKPRFPIFLRFRED